MLRKPLFTLLAIVAMCLVDATMARADTINISNTDSGWYDSTGFHLSTHTNYYSADSDYRNFFVFNLASAAGETITSAQLQLFTYSIFGSGTYTTYDVVTPVPILTAGGSGQLATYDDLGGGASFGSISLSFAQSNSLILINLNAAAIAAIQAQANVTGMFAIGGVFPGPGNGAYGGSFFNTANQLILQTGPSSVPDSASTLALMLCVIVLFGLGVKFWGTSKAQAASDPISN